MTFFAQILQVALSAAPWLLLGLIIAGLIKAWVDDALLKRWVGGEGLAATVRAAVVGAPLPLCSCGAIPTALTLHRAGAGRGPTTAFLIGTPGIGADSLAISYALLGPVMMAARALGAIITAITTGLLVGLTGRQPTATPRVEAAHAHTTHSTEADTGCGGCCKSACSSTPQIAVAPPPETPRIRLRKGMQYAFVDLLTDIGPWLLGGLIVAGVIMAWIPPQSLAQYGHNPMVMVLMAVVGVPLYICASAATPVAAGMLLAGVSPGAVLVFLLAGPITSIATLGLLRRELGTAGVITYLAGIIGTTIIIGFAFNAWLAAANLDITAHVGAVEELLPAWLEGAALLLLLWFGTRRLRDHWFKRQQPHAQH